MAGPRVGGGHGGPRALMPGEKAKDFKGTMGKLMGYLKKFLPSIFLVLCCAAASTVFSIFGPKILGKATTRLFEGLVAMLTGTGSIDFSAIAQILTFLAGLYVLSALLSYVQGWVMSGVATKLSYSMRKDISEKIDRMPLSYFDRVPNGEVLSRITNDVDTITQTLNQSLSQIVTNITMMIGVLCMMLSISPMMTLIALCILPLSVLIVSNVVKRSQPFFRKQQEYLGHVNGHVEEMYGAHTVVTAFNGQENSIKTFEQLNDNLYGAAWKSQFLSGIMMPLMNFVGNLGYVGICVLGGFLSLRGTITVGDIQAFTQYVRNFTQPITQIANISNVLQQTAAASERVFAFLEEQEEPAGHRFCGQQRHQCRRKKGAGHRRRLWYTRGSLPNGNDCQGTALRQGCTDLMALEMMPQPPAERSAANPWPEWPRVLKVDYGQTECLAKFGKDPRVYQTTVKEFLKDESGNLTGAVIRTLKPERDPETGRTNMVPTGEEFTYDCQLAFIAAGFTGCENYTADAFGVELTARGTVADHHFKTNVEKVFVCGDMRRGQSLVVWGLREGRDCAAEVDRYLMGYTNL